MIEMCLSMYFRSLITHKTQVSLCLIGIDKHSSMANR